MLPKNLAEKKKATDRKCMPLADPDKKAMPLANTD